MRRYLAAVVLLLGCGSRQDAVAVFAVAAMAGSMAASAAENHERTGCYNPCMPGTACNPSTGVCEELPCRDACRDDERCVRSSSGARCEKLGKGSAGPQEPPDRGPYLPPLEYR